MLEESEESEEICVDCGYVGDIHTIGFLKVLCFNPESEFFGKEPNLSGKCPLFIWRGDRGVSLVNPEIIHRALAIYLEKEKGE